MKRSNEACHHRRPSPKEYLLATAGYDEVEKTVLEIARHYFQTFAIPQSQSWLRALQRAEAVIPGEQASNIGLDILAAVQAMRTCRSSCFQFNNPLCPGCAKIVSEHERQFLAVFQAMRHGREGPARTHALILCEGNDHSNLLHRMSILARSIEEAFGKDAPKVSLPHLV